MTPILKISSLTTKIKSNEKLILEDISFDLHQGEVLGLIGESGSGKTQITRSIINLLAKNLEFVKGEVIYKDIDLLKSDETSLQNIRGNKISIVIQESYSSLNPTVKIGDQISETIIAHQNLTKEEAKNISISFLEQVGFSNPIEIFEKYPHQLSGGMRQKVLIAIAICNDPDIIIADEPTSSLDFNSELEIIELFKKINQETKASIIFVTHNINILRDFANNIFILRDGKIIEKGTAENIFNNPLNDFTKDLIKNLI